MLARPTTNAFVADRRSDAESLGRRLADEIGDPDAFTRMLRDGFEDLAISPEDAPTALALLD